MPGVENSLNIALFFVLRPIRNPVFPYVDKFPRGLVGNNRFHIPVVPLQDNAQKVCTMVVKKPVVVAPQPVMDSDGKTEDDECPPYQIRTILISELFRPPDLE